MKTLLILFFCFFLSVFSYSRPKENFSPQPFSIIKTQANLNANNVSSWFWNTGVFDQNLSANNTPGYEWPKGSGKSAIFTTGLSMAAYINGNLRLASVSYNGEYAPGHVVNGAYQTDPSFKIYRVTRGDNNSNPDYANWGLMVPYGAPYDDVNNNGIFDAGVDKPGVKNSAQTIFVCLTDADPGNHSSSEGFSGGTLPVFAEMHLTAWVYNDVLGLNDVQFMKMEIVNKNSSPWMRTHFGIVCDPDLGDALDDYVGCDIQRNLGYCYNSDNEDGTGGGSTYGANPPAVGFDMLKGAVNRSVNPNADLYMTSFCQFLSFSQFIPCESDPSGSPIFAFNYLRGLKRDSTKFVNPLTMQSTKYCFSGDPETNTGWTQYTGKIENCNGDTTGTVVPSVPGDKRFVMGSGADNLTIVPGEKQTFVFAKIIARGTSNLNSVTKLKQLSDVAQAYYSANFNVGVNTLSSNIPDKYSLYQNYPNPFNPSTKIKFDLNKSGFTSLKIYDVSGKEIAALVNQNLTAGSYEFEFNALNLPSGVYFYKLETAEFSSVKKMSLIK